MRTESPYRITEPEDLPKSLTPARWFGRRGSGEEEGEAVRENAHGSTAYTLPRDRIASITPTEERIDVVCRSRAGGYRRAIPLSEPGAAETVIHAAGRSP